MNKKIYFKNLFIKNYQTLLVIIFLAIQPTFLKSQDLQIGIEYFKAKEYAKAVTVFEKIAKDKNQAAQIHEYYLKAYDGFEGLEKCREILQKTNKSR